MRIPRWVMGIPGRGMDRMRAVRRGVMTGKGWEFGIGMTMMKLRVTEKSMQTLEWNSCIRVATSDMHSFTLGFSWLHQRVQSIFIYLVLRFSSKTMINFQKNRLFHSRANFLTKKNIIVLKNSWKQPCSVSPYCAFLCSIEISLTGILKSLICTSQILQCKLYSIRGLNEMSRYLIKLQLSGLNRRNINLFFKNKNSQDVNKTSWC